MKMKFAMDLSPGDLIVDAPITWDETRGMIISNIDNSDDDDMVRLTLLRFGGCITSRLVLRTRQFKVAL